MNFDLNFDWYFDWNFFQNFKLNLDENLLGIKIKSFDENWYGNLAWEFFWVYLSEF